MMWDSIYSHIVKFYTDYRIKNSFQNIALSKKGGEISLKGHQGMLLNVFDSFPPPLKNILYSAYKIFLTDPGYKPG